MDNIFDKFRAFGQFVKGLNREMVADIGKQTVKYAVKKMAEQHADKKYKTSLVNQQGETECEFIIIPKSNNYVAGLGNLIKDRFEFQSGKLKVDIQLMPDESKCE
ncbi:hypothetical protein [Emticicia sp. BO119]|uniref:hypothetical protein n=1 Tax=Emticicia sp. BO119 TaxID=2757768 RepID=UPI0015F08C4C|nr:hypothetical protein [Emticicia sp. BO119]MBA4849505.1 hypothetical protein [Emticicia sp. BO119]